MFRGKKIQDSDSEKPEVASSLMRVRAADGALVPLYYKGSIIHIGQSVVEIDRDALEYEPKIQFDQALKDNHLIEESK